MMLLSNAGIHHCPTSNEAIKNKRDKQTIIFSAARGTYYVHCLTSTPYSAWYIATAPQRKSFQVGSTRLLATIF